MRLTRTISKIVLIALAGSVAVAGDSAVSPTQLKGVVLDESGAVIPGATARLLNKVTQKTERAVTTENGEFQFGLEPDGDYVISIRAEGFQHREVPVKLPPPGAGPMRLFLEVAESAEKISVTARAFAAPSVNDPPNAVPLVDSFIRDLPHKNGDPLAIPSLFASPAITGAAGPKLIVDGVETDSLDLPLSAVKQVTINPNPYSAEFSRPGRGRLEVITNKGSRREFRANLALILRNAAMNARDPFAKVHPLAARGIADANVEGPITPLLSVMAAIRYDKENAHGLVNAFTPQGNIIGSALEPLRKTAGFTRLDYRSPSRTHKAILTYKFKNHSDRNRGVGGFNLPEHGTELFDHENEIKFLDTNMGSSLLNQFGLTLKQNRRDLTSLAPGPRIEVLGAFNGAGAEVDQRLHELGATIQNYSTLARGVHAIRFGGTVKLRHVRSSDRENFGGTYLFSSLDDFENKEPFALEINRGDPAVSFGHYEFASFVQDDIRVRPNLSVLLGIRHEAQTRVARINNFAPRFGLAYSPGRHNTVLRAGAGIFYERQSVELQRLDLLYSGLRIQQFVVEDPGFPAALDALLPVTPQSLKRLDPLVRLPYLLQAGVGIDQHVRSGAVVSVEYYTLRGVHLYQTRNVNAPGPAGIRPDRAYVNINQVESSGLSRSNNLAVTFRAQAGRKTQLLAQYTLSRTMDDTGDMFRLPANNYDLRPEWGRADLDQLHRFNFVGTHRLPGQLRLGWVATWRSGLPYDITTGFDDNGDTAATDRPPRATRNTGQGPGFSNIDLRLGRDVKFGLDGKYVAGIGVEAFNVLNHVSLRNFIGVQTSPFFGHANAAFPVRQLQLSLRMRR